MYPTGRARRSRSRPWCGGCVLGLRMPPRCRFSSDTARGRHDPSKYQGSTFSEPSSLLLSLSWRMVGSWRLCPRVSLVRGVLITFRRPAITSLHSVQAAPPPCRPNPTPTSPLPTQMQGVTVASPGQATSCVTTRVPGFAANSAKYSATRAVHRDTRNKPRHAKVPILTNVLAGPGI